MKHRNYLIHANFEKNILIYPEPTILVEEDYNSVEFDFEFDVENGTKVLEIKKPDGTVWVKEIVDNKVVLVDKNTNDEMIPVINQSGLYQFEVSLYTENSKLTISKIGKFEARDEVVTSDDEQVKSNSGLPILDDLINKVETQKKELSAAIEDSTTATNEAVKTTEEMENLKTEVENKASNGSFNGATFIPTVDEDGNISWSNDKNLANPDTVNIMGPQGPQGIQGEAFKIKKTYSNKQAMKNDFSNMDIGDYVMITSNIEVEDNAKLYCRGEEEWIYITDFSGATGIQGPQGPQGIQGIQGIQGPKPVKGVDYFTDAEKSEMVQEIIVDSNNAFNKNVEEKTNEYNENHEAKIQEYNENTNSVIDIIDHLIPKSEVSGNMVQIVDSLDYKVLETKLSGNYEQKTTKGINKLKLSLSEITVNGITVKNNGDGSITVNGTSTEVCYINLNNNSGYYFNLENGKNYTSYLGGVGTNGVRLVTRSVTQNYPLLQTISTNAESNTQTYEYETDEKCYSYLYIASGRTIEKLTLYPMIVEGDSAGEFEIFTGNMASPNPDYPQEVKFVTSYNLFDKNNPNILTDTYIGQYGTAGTATGNKIIYIPIEKDAYYTIQKIKSNRFRVGTFSNLNISGNTLNNYKANNDNLTIYTLKNDSDSYLFLQYFGNDENEQEIIDSILITKGTAMHKYLPHGNIGFRVVNKNFLKNELVSQTVEDVEFTVNADKTITANGTATAGISLNLWDYSLIPAGEYILSDGLSNPTNSTYFLYADTRDENGNATQDLNLSTTAESTAKRCFAKEWQFNPRIVIREGQTLNNVVFKPMLRLANVSDDSYEEYHEQIVYLDLQDNFIGKLPNGTANELMVDNLGNVTLFERIGKGVLDGTENWNINSETDDYFEYVCNINEKAASIYTLSNYFSNTNNCRIIILNGYIYLRYPKKSNIDVSSLDKFKKFLTENNVIFYYELLSENTISLGKLDELIQTKSGINNIYPIVNLESKISVKYALDIKKYIDNQNAIQDTKVSEIETLIATPSTASMLLENYANDLESEV